VIVNPLRVPRRVLNELEASLIVCFSGQARESAAIIAQQTSGIVNASPAAMDALQSLKLDAMEMKKALLSGDFAKMARVLDRSWQAKKATAEAVTNERIDVLDRFAREKGATGSKVSGAGGGGFMMFMTEPENRTVLMDALNSAKAIAHPVKLTDTGSETWQPFT